MLGCDGRWAVFRLWAHARTSEALQRRMPPGTPTPYWYRPLCSMTPQRYFLFRSDPQPWALDDTVLELACGEGSLADGTTRYEEIDRRVWK